MSFFDELPAGRNTDETEERESMIVGAVVAQQHDPFEWWGVEVSDKDGNDLTFYIMRDALKIDGVRINVSATGAQQIADVLSALLPTALMTDLAWESAFQIPPSPQQITATTKAMIDHSARVDALIGSHDDELVADVGKYWILTNKLVQRPPGARLPAGIVSANYGWHFKGENFQGLRGEMAVSLRERVIQGVGLAHDRWHTDYCLVPGTRVLTADLRWLPIETINVGDELIGFDEKLGGHRMRGSAVLSKTFLSAPCYEVVTDRGTIVASAAHLWVAGFDHSRRRWIRTDALKKSHTISFLCDPWQEDRTWDGGWMAGFLDGEGWVSQGLVGFGQNEGHLLDRACSQLKAAGFEFYGRKYDKSCVKLAILGEWGSLRVLGQYRPFRLLGKSRRLWEGRRPCGGPRERPAHVLEVRPLGVRDVVGLGTSTKTLIAEGFLSHNSQVCRLVSAYATLNGQKVFLADVLTDPDTAHLVSNEGALLTTRQPAVDPIACPLPPSIAGLGQCPLPDEPGWPAGAPAGKMLGEQGGMFGSSRIGILGKSLLIGGVGVGAYALARRFFP